MSELNNPTRAAVIAGLHKASLFDRYRARSDALEMAMRVHVGQLGGADEIIATAQRFYDFTLDIAGPSQAAFADGVQGE